MLWIYRGRLADVVLSWRTHVAALMSRYMYAFFGRREWVFCTRTMHDRPYMLNTLYPALTGTLRVMEPIKFKMPWTYDKGCLYAVFLQYMIEHPSFRCWCFRGNMAVHALNELVRMFREISLCGFVQNRPKSFTGVPTAEPRSVNRAVQHH